MVYKVFPFVWCKTKYNFTAEFCYILKNKKTKNKTSYISADTYIVADLIVNLRRLVLWYTEWTDITTGR